MERQSFLGEDLALQTPTHKEGAPTQEKQKSFSNGMKAKMQRIGESSKLDQTTATVQQDAGETALTSHASSTAKCDQYAMNPYLLYFTDPETEQRYFDFQYVDNPFIPGKIFAGVWTGVSLMSFVIFTEPFSNGASYTVQAFSSPWWVGSYVSTGVNIILSVGLFLDRFRRYREIIHIAQVVVGWPTFALCIMYTKRPHAYTYATLFGAFLVSMLIAQCRLHRNVIFVSVVPLTCLFAVTFGIKEYWEHHTKMEMLYWLILTTPLALVHFLERQVVRESRSGDAGRSQSARNLPRPSLTSSTRQL